MNAIILWQIIKSVNVKLILLLKYWNFYIGTKNRHNLVNECFMHRYLFQINMSSIHCAKKERENLISRPVELDLKHDTK